MSSAVEEQKIITVAAANDEKRVDAVKTDAAAAAADAIDAADNGKQSTPTKDIVIDDAYLEQDRAEKILRAKELYSHGSRNFLVKCYAEAADELSQVCGLYEELYGELSDELGMPYLLYAKSLIALALDENKVIDVPEAENEFDEDVDDADDDDEAMAVDAAATSSSVAGGSSATAKRNGATTTKLDSIKEDGDDAADSTGDAEQATKPAASVVKKPVAAEEAEVSSSGAAETKEESAAVETKGESDAAIVDNEKPSTSNGDAGEGVEEEEDDEDAEAASSLQLAWEILETAAKIFSRQGLSGLANLAEVQTELANIEFENSILDAARDDYEKALKIYQELPTNYRRAMAEIHYKIGLTFLMQQMNKEGAVSLKDACTLIEAEIDAIKTKEQPSEKDKNTIQDLEETKQEIWAKITEIEEMQAQTIAEVRAALDSYIKPTVSGSGAASIGSDTVAAASSSSSSTAAAASSSVANGKAVADATSSSSSTISSSSKPTDISHLIKRKKVDEPNSEAEAVCSPAKRAAV